MSFLFARRASASEARRTAELLHDHLVAAIRRPIFYLKLGVPDTFEGRFDLLVLHVAVVLRRLRALGTEGQEVGQHLVDTMFSRLDIAMRELGVSDLGVPKRMKRLAEAFNGRTASYHAALDTGNREALGQAIQRNVLAGRGNADDLASYVLETEAMFSRFDLSSAKESLPIVPEPRDVAESSR